MTDHTRILHGKILAAALPIPGIWDATEAVSQLARSIRTHDRSLKSSDLIQLPIVDGGVGTIDFLVTHTLGSFLEVEAKDARGKDIVVPIGFAGEDGKLAVIEMSRVARVQHAGDSGTTAGIGELIQDALDEGAFSILLGLEEPLACDAGLGAAAALGVKFFDASDKEMDFILPGTAHDRSYADISRIAKVDASTRSFSLLSSRIFIARAGESIENQKPDNDLAKLAEIIRRDTGIHPSLKDLSPSAIEFGLSAFLGAEIRDGAALVLEASGINEAITRGEFSEFIFLTPSLEALEHDSLPAMLKLVREKVKHRAIVVAGERMPGAKSKGRIADDAEPHFYLKDVPLFQAPVDERSSIDEKRRDFTARLEKLVPTVLEDLRRTSSAKEIVAKGSRA